MTETKSNRRPWLFAGVAAVLANQLVANYLPAVPGWFATTHLIRRGYV